MANLSTLVRGGTAAFFGWWLGELAGLVPARFRQAGRRERRGPILVFGRTEATVLERTAEGERALGSVPLDDPDRERHLAALLGRVRRRRRGVTLRLGGELGLRKVLDLPLAARDDLEPMLRLEMDRLTPFKADEVCFAHRVLGSDPQGRRLAVELQVAPRREVERAVEVAHGLGVVPAGVELAGRGAEGGPPLNLLAEEAGHKGREGRLSRALALIALALAVAAVAIPLQRQRATLAELEAEVAAARTEAEESIALRERLDRLTESAAFLLADKTRQPMVVEVLDELTRMVPDQAYIMQLELHDGIVDLHGYASTASDLIGVLEQSPLFRAPQFRSPVTQDPRSGTERFHLSVELTPQEGG